MLLNGGIAVGDALRLDALSGVHHQQRALAGGQRTRHLVGEIHVPRRINDIELIGTAIASRIAQRHALRLDGDAALPLQVHRIEHLLGHFPRAQAAAKLNEAVGERGLAVVNVGDNRKIANVIHGFHYRSASNRLCRMAGITAWTGKPPLLPGPEACEHS